MARNARKMTEKKRNGERYENNAGRIIERTRRREEDAERLNGYKADANK